jgi:uncharacterized phiE125 gp8 family phage protein
LANAPTLVTAPTSEPVTMAEAKGYLRQDLSDEDALIGALVAAARQYVERALNRALITQTWRLKLDDFYCAPYYCETDNTIRLPRVPLQSVSSITYLDYDGTSQTWSSTEYQVDAASEPGRVTTASGEWWPETQSEAINAVTITYVAGYGAAADVPQGIRQALLFLVKHWFDQREPVSATGAIPKEVPLTVDALLAIHEWGNYC